MRILEVLVYAVEINRISTQLKGPHMRDPTSLITNHNYCTILMRTTSQNTRFATTTVGAGAQG